MRRNESCPVIHSIHPPRVLFSLLFSLLAAGALLGCAGGHAAIQVHEAATPAQVNTWLDEAFAAWQRKDYATAIPLFQKAADAGNMHSMYVLGVLYENGEGIERDYAEAMRWYRKAVDAGHVDVHDRVVVLSTRHVGGLYNGGYGVSRDGAEAMKWYHKAADEGDTLAMSNIGALFANGDGVPRDYVEAMKWFRKAADGGEPLAMLNVGRLYDDGHGVPQDPAEAKKWYQRAADTQDPQVRETARQRGIELPPPSAHGNY